MIGEFKVNNGNLAIEGCEMYVRTKGRFRVDPRVVLFMRELQGNKATDSIASRLHSRLVSRSERETEEDKAEIETSGSPGSERVSNNALPDKVKTALSH
jgi:hypothetical protein